MQTPHPHAQVSPDAAAPRRLLFVALAYSLSWLAWAPLVLAAQRGVRAWPYFHLVGGVGPAVAAIVVTRLAGRSSLRELLSRLNPRRAAPLWLGIAVLGPIGLFLLGAVVLRLTGHPWPRLADFGASKEYPDLGRAGYWVANILLYGYGEEIGWRGFLLPALQRRRGSLGAAIRVGLVWAGWHLPLFWFAAGLHAMGPPAIVGWLFSMLTGSILMAWLFNRSGSITAVALFHGVLDIVIGSPGHPMMANIMGAALTVWGIAVIFTANSGPSSQRHAEDAPDRGRDGHGQRPAEGDPQGPAAATRTT
jgi:membrane protease YdiL (CAAX protease family)